MRAVARLWVCPAGRHPAVRGPERPRKNATCRFCLPCSAGSPALVERVAPALVRRREASAASNAARAVVLKDRVRAAAEVARTAYPVGWLREWHAVLGGLTTWGRGVGPDRVAATIRTARPRRLQVKGAVQGRDVTDTTGRVWPAWSEIGAGVDGPVWMEEPPPLRTSGHAWGHHRITLTAGTDRADALATLIHELAHCATGHEDGPHGDAWRSTFVAAAEELTGRSIVGVTPDGKRRSGLDVHDLVRVLIETAGLHTITDPREYNVG